MEDLKPPAPKPAVEPSAPVAEDRVAAPMAPTARPHRPRRRQPSLFAVALVGFCVLGLAAVAMGVIVATKPMEPQAPHPRVAVLTPSQPPPPAAETVEEPTTPEPALRGPVAPVEAAPNAKPAPRPRKARLAEQAPTPSPEVATPEPLVLESPPDPLALPPITPAEPPKPPRDQLLADPEAPIATRGDEP